MNDALPLLSIVLANKAKESEETDETYHIESEALNGIAPGLPVVSKTETAPFIEPKTARFLPEQSKDTLLPQPSSTVGTMGSDYSYILNGLLTRIAFIDITVHKLVQRSLQVRLLHAYHYPRPPGHPGERSMYDTM